MRKQTFLGITLVVLAALACPPAGRAAVLFLAAPDQSGASDMNQYVEADDFVNLGTMHVTSVTFWAMQNDASDYAGSTTIGLLNDDAGVPGTTISTISRVLTGTATGNTAFGLTEFVYQFNVNVTLGPGTYWLALHNGPLNTVPTTQFYWEWSADVGNSQSKDLGPPVGPWVGNFSELAFQLDGTTSVPEPGTGLLIGAGLVGAWAVRRRIAN